MPTNRFRTTKQLTKPWHARATANGVRYDLGYFSTYEEALAEEEAFRREANTHPRLRPRAEAAHLVAELHSNGHSLKDIAKMLNRAYGTVKKDLQYSRGMQSA